MDGKILVTGASGFVGGAVVRELLARGYKVRGTGRKPRPVDFPVEAEYESMDLCDRKSLPPLLVNCAAIIHVAAKAGVWGSRESFYRANVQATRNLLELSESAGICYFVHTSTPSVVYNGKSIQGGDESLPYGNSFPCEYLSTKAEAEKMVLAANGEDGLRTLALRPHLVWGPGDPHLFPRVFERVRQGRLRQVGKGTNRVDLTFIDNVAQGHVDALEALAEGKGGGEAYFLTQDEPVELWPFVNRVLEGAGYPRVEKKLPLGAAKGIGAICEVVWRLLRRESEPPMTRFVAVELAKDHWFSSQKARSTLGYQPKVSMEEGLQRYLESLPRE